MATQGALTSAIPPDDIGRAFVEVTGLLAGFQFVVAALQNRLPPATQSITLPVTANDSGVRLVLQFPPRPTAEEVGLTVLRETLPDRCRSLIAAFPESLRFELAGVHGVADEGSMSASSAHFMACDLAHLFLRAKAQGQDRGFVESLPSELNLDRLLARVEAEYGAARRRREFDGRDRPGGGRSSQDATASAANERNNVGSGSSASTHLAVSLVTGPHGGVSGAELVVGEGRGAVHAQIRGPTAARLLKAVADQPGRTHPWRELLQAGLEAGWWRLSSAKTLERCGRRVRASLPVSVRARWQQDGHGVVWVGD